MNELPRTRFFDSTIGLARDGYRFTSKRCERFGTDAFRTRLLFKKTICMRGEEAAKFFYSNEIISRKNVLPGSVLKTLFGVGGVQGLDGQAHHHRKQMFMSLMTKEGIENLMTIMLKYWDKYIDKWEGMDKVVFFNESSELIMEAVCEWCGVPLSEDEISQRTGEIKAMIEGPGSFGLRNYKGRRGRKSSERWIRKLINDVRSGDLQIGEDTALKRVALHRDMENDQLDPQIAAVELINVIRPTVAIARFITFMAVSLQEHPEYKDKVQQNNKNVEFFVQETRRLYSFFPFVAGRTTREVEWNGYRIPGGIKILLDLFGTNRDPESWEEPNKFKPERFQNWDKSPFNFIPQGGGNHHKNHRCPGEWITIETMKLALRIMTGSMEYQVPDQDLTIDYSRMPMIPKSRFVIKNVKKVNPNIKGMDYEYTREDSEAA